MRDFLYMHLHGWCFIFLPLLSTLKYFRNCLPRQGFAPGSRSKAAAHFSKMPQIKSETAANLD